MNARSTSPLLAGSLLLNLAAALPAQPPISDAAPGLTVQVFNFAAAPASVLRRAGKTAALILRQGGAPVAWVDCPLDWNQARAIPQCVASGPTTLKLVLSPSEGNPSLPRTVLGFATPDPAFPFLVTIFYPRIHKLAESRIGSEDEILGPAIAHELGHLCLGSAFGFGAHSNSGVMCARWDATQIHLAQVEQLRFSRQEAATIQADVARRLAAASSQSTPAPAVVAAN